ncbi:hypothetical protein [Aeromicrobium sp. UC242_57]|uniref:hypothetical protein n=1 Tax=Aeromicrobium sp. UC242_57 TaxID=3374624 RepID=UPI0037B630D9
MGGEDRFLAPLAARLDSSVLWELLDWSTVVLEPAVLVTVVSWTWFRRTLLAVVAFHVGVLLVLNIAFAANVVAYGAFVRWSRWWPDAGRRRCAPATLVAVGTGAAVTSWLVAATISPTAELYVKGAFVVTGAVVALILCVRRRLRPLASTTSSG